MLTANYINNGYEILPSINNRINLEEFRNIIEASFKNLNYPSVMYPCLSNSEVSNYLISHIFNDHMSLFMNNLSELVGQEVLIFPTLEIMRNYFSCPALGRQGWHSDCNGELVYFECKSILKKPSYCFGKIGFYLQKNTDFGGQIDLLPRSHINVRESRQSISKFNIKLSNQLIKLGLGKFSLCNNWLSDIVVLNKKSINLMPMDLILFDSGIIHRGSPLKSTVLKEFKNISQNSFDGGSHLDANLVDLGANNKYAIYLQFGTIDGLKSYYFDRSKRNTATQEFDLWRAHFKNDSFLRIPKITKSEEAFIYISGLN